MSALALLYARIPKLSCAGKCQKCCGPIDASPVEKMVFERAVGRPLPDMLVVLQSKTLTCPELNVVGQCSVYRYRPLICRLWGVTEHMQCPFGCVPDRWLSEVESRAMLEEADAIAL